MNPDVFVRWALDDARTLEERYGVQIVAERCYGLWKARHNFRDNESWETQNERRRQRQLNPAWQPDYTESVLVRAAEVLHEITLWYAPSPSYEREQRDIKALRFLPNLVDVHLEGDVTDFSPLMDLPHLRKLTIQGREGQDYGILGQLRSLRELNLTIGGTWPEVAGLENLVQLETLSLSGNLLAFERGTAFPKVVRGTLLCSPLAARSVRDLPQLPACQFLRLSGVDRLDGIEAFPRLRNLTLEGNVRDYTRLTTLHDLSWLSCNGEKPLDVSPLIHIPKLTYLEFTYGYASGIRVPETRDYSPLAEAPSLHELSVPYCAPTKTEVAALNATFDSWDEMFRLAAPRPLPLLRLVSAPLEKLPRKPDVHVMPGEREPIDKGIRACEGRWAAKQITRAVTNKLGSSDWGECKADSGVKARSVNLHIHSFAVVEKLEAIVEATREALAQMKPDYTAALYVDLKVPRPEPTKAQKELKEQFEREQRDFEYEKGCRERAEQLDRLHRFRLKQQEGGTVRAEEFAAPSPIPAPPPPWEREDEQEDEESGFGGDIAVKQQPDPPPSWFDDEHPLADNYRMWGVISLSEAWLSGDAGLVAFTMGRTPDQVIVREKR